MAPHTLFYDIESKRNEKNPFYTKYVYVYIDNV